MQLDSSSEEELKLFYFIFGALIMIGQHLHMVPLEMPLKTIEPILNDLNSKLRLANQSINNFLLAKGLDTQTLKYIQDTSYDEVYGLYKKAKKNVMERKMNDD